MTIRRRVSVAVGAVLIGATGMLGLAGCGAADRLVGGSGSGSGAASPSGVPAAAADTAAAAEQQALVQFGLDPSEVAASGTEPVAADSGTPTATPSGGPSAAGGAGRARHPYGRIARRLGGPRTLHGEIVVRAKDGTTKTVVVQRGTVTAITATSVTVRSTDGYTLTWVFGKPLRVIEHRATVDAGQVKAGAEIALAGVKNGTTPTARLIVLRPGKGKQK